MVKMALDGKTVNNANYFCNKINQNLGFFNPTEDCGRNYKETEGLYINFAMRRGMDESDPLDPIWTNQSRTEREGDRRPKQELARRRGHGLWREGCRHERKGPYEPRFDESRAWG